MFGPEYEDDHAANAQAAGRDQSPQRKQERLEALVDRLLDGSLGELSTLTGAINLSLGQIASWIADARNRQRIDDLLELLDAQARLVIGQQRVFAAQRLVDVIEHCEAGETVRRACVDLLKIGVTSPTLPKRETHVSDEAILNTIAAIAAREGVPADDEPRPMTRRERLEAMWATDDESA